MLARSSQRETVEALRQCLREEGTAHPEFFSGLAGDLPKAIRRGTLIEYLAESGSGATALALMTAREACCEGGALVVIDRSRTILSTGCRFFPREPRCDPHSAADAKGRTHGRSIKTLRCPGVGALLAWPDQLEERAFRGLQIAAEAGGTVGLFIRSTKVRGQPAWSDMQLLIEALPGETLRRLRVEVVRSRSGCEGVWDILELDDETPAIAASRSVSLAAALAAATGATRPVPRLNDVSCRSTNSVRVPCE